MSSRVMDADGVAPTLDSGSGPNRGGTAGPMVAAPADVVPALTTRAGNTQDDQQTGQLVAGPLATGQTPEGHGMAGVNDQAVAAGHVVASTLKSQEGRGWTHDPEATYVPEETSATLKGQRGRGGGGIGPEETLLAVPISQDATYGEGEAKTPSRDARGDLRLRDPGLGVGAEGDPAFTVAAAGPGAVAAPLTGGGHPNSNVPGRRKEDDENLTVAYSIVPEGGQGADLRAAETDVSNTLDSLNAQGHDRGTRIVTKAQAFETRFARNGRGAPSDVVPPLKAQSGETGKGDGAPMVAAASVRRLTPRECERLQGLPDDWTRIEDDTADSRRYSGLGDAVTVDVARWIGERIASELP